MQPGVLPLGGGGVLSPFLWLLVTNVDLRLLESRGFKVVAYADYVAILMGGKFL